MPPEQSFFNPTIYGKPLFPSNFGSRAIGAITRAITPSAGTPPATMAGVSPIPTGASLSQLRFTGPLISSDKSRRAAMEEPNVTIPDRGIPWDAPRSIGPAFIPKPTGFASPALPPSDAERMYGFSQMSPQARSVVSSAAGFSGPLNAQYSPTLPQTTLSQYSVPSISAPQLGIGMGSQIAEINRPSFNNIAGGPQSAQQLPAVTQQIPIQRTPIQTPYGTIFATSEAPKGQQSQAQLLASRPTAYEGRTPAEQRALLAKMRSQGANIMRNNINSQEQFFAQKRAERSGLAQAEAFARAGGATSMDIMRARDTQPSTIADIQRQFVTSQQRLPMEGLAARGVVDFGKNLRISPIKYGALGPSGSTLERLQQQSRRLM